MRFFIYSRKSIDTGKGKSTENQIEMCKEYIASKFGDALETDIFIYEDEGYSGKTTERPAFQRMMKDIEENAPDCVLCYRLDRISRSVSNFSTLIEQLNNRNITFICIKEEFDTSKPMGKAMMYIASVFAQLERETIAERVRDNMLMLARMGRWLGGTTPLGFTSQKQEEMIVDGKIKSAYKLVECSEEINIVKTIYYKFLELHSIAGVSKFLISQKITARLGNFFSPIGIKEILQNPVYCTADQNAFDYFVSQKADVCFNKEDYSDEWGLISYNKRDYKKKNMPRQPKSQWIIAIGKHRGLIPGKKWVEVQNILEANKPRFHAPTNMHNDYSLLSGRIICTKCDSKMFAKPHSNHKENGLFYYICQNKIRGGLSLCQTPNLNGRQTDEAVCQYIADYIVSSPSLCVYLEEMKGSLQRYTIKSPIEGVQAEIRKRQEEMNALLSVLLQPNLNHIVIEKINDRMTNAQLKLEALQKRKKQLEETQTKDTMASSLPPHSLLSIQAMFPFLTVQEKRKLLDILVQKLDWNGQRLNILIYAES